MNPRRTNLTAVAVILSTIFQVLTAQAQNRAQHVPDFLNAAGPKAKIMLMGTFHFKDGSRDSYQPKYDVDILSEARQQQVGEIVGLLEGYKPTKVAVEVVLGRQAWLDSLYQDYLAGNLELGSNEVFQLGFRLAKRLGHKRLYAVDARGRSYFPNMTQEEYQARAASLVEGVDPAVLAAEAQWERRFEKLYSYKDSLKIVLTLREQYLYENMEDNIRRGHGHYLVGSFKLGRGDDYLGPDMKTRWYNRNLRIFHNLQRITESPADRILLIIGSGHLPILRHTVRSSPEYDLVEISTHFER